MARLVVGHDSGTYRACFAGDDTPRACPVPVGDDTELDGFCLVRLGSSRRRIKARHLMLTRGRACPVRWRVCLGRHITPTMNRFSEPVFGLEIASAKRRVKT